MIPFIGVKVPTPVTAENTLRRAASRSRWPWEVDVLCHTNQQGSHRGSAVTAEELSPLSSTLGSLHCQRIHPWS